MAYLLKSPAPLAGLEDAFYAEAPATSAACSGLEPSVTLEQFVFDRAELPPQHESRLNAIAQCILASQTSQNPIHAVHIVGHTDPVGSAAYNMVLAQRRAESARTRLLAALDRARPGAGRTVTITVESRGEREPVAGDRGRSRRVQILLRRSSGSSASGVRTKTIEVVVKSFIAPVGTRIGSLPWRCAPLVLPALPFVPPGFPAGPLGPTTASQRLQWMARGLDFVLRDVPRSAARDKRYRMYSRVAFTVTHTASQIIRVVPSAISTDEGLEPLLPPPTRVGLTPPPLLIPARRFAPAGPRAFDFSWMATGRPHNLAEPLFFWVCPRTSRYIWHEISGRIELQSGVPTVSFQLRGSRFPSHIAYIDGRPARSIAQGGLANLWVAAPGHPTRVR